MSPPAARAVGSYGTLDYLRAAGARLNGRVPDAELLEEAILDLAGDLAHRGPVLLADHELDALLEHRVAELAILRSAEARR